MTPSPKAGVAITALSLPRHTASGWELGGGLTIGGEERDPLAGPFGWHATAGVVLDDAELLRPALAASLAGEPIAILAPRVGRLAAQLDGQVTARLNARGYAFAGITAELRNGMREALGGNVGLRLSF